MDTAADQQLVDRIRVLEEQVRLYEAILATGPVSAYVYDSDMNSRWSTACLRPELGYEGSSPMSAEDDYALVHPDDRPRARGEARDLLRGDGVEPSRLRVGSAEGEWRWVAILAANLVDDPDLGSIVVHSGDITAAVQHEAEVHASERRQQRLLAMERAARRSLEEQNDRLRELDDLKTAFVATVSHELRTPLAALRSYIDLLLDPEAETLSNEQRGLAEAVRRGALRLGRLVDDLLVLAQLQTGSMPLERSSVDVADAVGEAISDVRRVAPEEITIVQHLDKGPSVATDRVRLTQVVSNLLGNAAKFAQGEVSCTAARRNGDWVIEIVDDGPGVAPDELERIFEPFYRGRPGGRARQGTGLGLPISAQLAELLGGSLTVRNSDTAAGVVARLTVPIGDEENGRVPN